MQISPRKGSKSLRFIDYFCSGNIRHFFPRVKVPRGEVHNTVPSSTFTTIIKSVSNCDDWWTSNTLVVCLFICCLIYWLIGSGIRIIWKSIAVLHFRVDMAMALSCAASKREFREHKNVGITIGVYPVKKRGIRHEAMPKKKPRWLNALISQLQQCLNSFGQWQEFW